VVPYRRNKSGNDKITTKLHGIQMQAEQQTLDTEAKVLIYNDACGYINKVDFGSDW
jgi:hypothetical protein